jgi:hypothetical protein
MFFMPTDCPLMLAFVLIVPDIVVAVKDAVPVALIANAPLHVMAKLNVFPEYRLSV